MDGELRLGGRLFRFRCSQPSDVEQLMRYAEDPNPRWVSMGLRDLPDRARFVVDEMAKGWAGHFGLARFLVDARTDLIVAKVTLARHAAGCVEVAYGVAPGQRRQGIATATLRHVTAWTLGNRIADRVEAVIDPTNAASIRVVVKVGFRYDGRRRDIVAGTGKAYEDLVYVLART